MPWAYRHRDRTTSANGENRKCSVADSGYTHTARNWFAGGFDGTVVDVADRSVDLDADGALAQPSTEHRSTAASRRIRPASAGARNQRPPCRYSNGLPYRWSHLQSHQWRPMASKTSASAGASVTLQTAGMQRPIDLCRRLMPFPLWAEMMTDLRRT